MTHVDAPLAATGRLPMVLRRLDDGIAKAHVATEIRGNCPTVTT